MSSNTYIDQDSLDIGGFLHVFSDIIERYYILLEPLHFSLNTPDLIQVICQHVCFHKATPFDSYPSLYAAPNQKTKILVGRAVIWYVKCLHIHCTVLFLSYLY